MSNEDLNINDGDEVNPDACYWDPTKQMPNINKIVEEVREAQSEIQQHDNMLHSLDSDSRVQSGSLKPTTRFVRRTHILHALLPHKGDLRTYLDFAPRSPIDHTEYNRIQKLINWYQESTANSKNVNNFFRSDSMVEDEDSEQVIQAFDKYARPLGAETVLFRTVDDHEGQNWSNSQVGEVLSDDGYLSTTLSVKSAVTGSVALQDPQKTVLIVQAPADAKAVIPADFGADSDDGMSEVILARGTKMEITDKRIVKEGDNQYNIITVKIIGQDSSSGVEK